MSKRRHPVARPCVPGDAVLAIACRARGFVSYSQAFMPFAELNLAAPLTAAVAACGYETPTPIQAQAIPALIAYASERSARATERHLRAKAAVKRLRALLWIEARSDLQTAGEKPTEKLIDVMKKSFKALTEAVLAESKPCAINFIVP